MLMRRVGVVGVGARRRRLMRTAARRRSGTTLVVRRREPVHRCGSRSRRRRVPRFRLGFVRIAAGEPLDFDERRVLERRVVVCEFGPASILDFEIHRDVRRRVVVLGIKVGRVDIETRAVFDGRFGKDGVEGRDGERAGPVFSGRAQARLNQYLCGRVPLGVGIAHGWVAHARRIEVGVSSATRRS